MHRILALMYLICETYHSHEFCSRAGNIKFIFSLVELKSHLGRILFLSSPPTEKQEIQKKNVCIRYSKTEEKKRTKSLLLTNHELLVLLMAVWVSNALSTLFNCVSRV